MRKEHCIITDRKIASDPTADVGTYIHIKDGGSAAIHFPAAGESRGFKTETFCELFYRGLAEISRDDGILKKLKESVKNEDSK
jgi:hypothetical protein